MKRFLIIVLTALCCVAMAACSGGKTPDNPTIVPDSVLLADREVTVYVGGKYKFEPTGGMERVRNGQRGSGLPRLRRIRTYV